MKNIYFVIVFLFGIFHNVKSQQPVNSALNDYAGKIRYTEDWKKTDTQSELIFYLEQLDTYINSSKKDSGEYSHILKHIALNYSKLGNNLLAYYYYQKLVKAFPDDTFARFDLAIELTNNRSYFEAEKEFDTACNSEPTSSFYLKRYGDFYFLQNNYKKALELYEQALTYSKPNSSKNYILIMIHLTNALLNSSYMDRKIESDVKEWPYPIISLLNKENDEALLVNEIEKTPDEDEKRGKLCETFFYVGLYNLIIGNKDIGATYLNNCIDVRIPAFIEDRFAKNILADGILTK